MKNIFNKLLSFFNPNSERNLDRKISFYKQEIKHYSNTSDIDHLEKEMSETTNEKVKHSLKIKLKENLKTAYQDYNYALLEDSIDKAW